MAEQHRVTIEGGTIAYQQAGSGPMVVMLHGIGGAAAQFRAQLAGLADEFTAIAWDAPGYGDSDDPDGDWRMPDYARRLAALLDHLTPDPVHILGQSWGGLLAQEFYRQYPARVRSLILSDTFAGSVVRPEEQRDAILQGRLDALATKTPAEMATARLPVLVTDDAPEAVKQEIETMLAAIHPSGYRQAAIALHHTDFLDLLPKITVPTLVIAGEHDRVVAMEHSRQLAEGIPGARLEVIAGSGHLSNQQKPDEYNAVVRAFLREVGGGR
ncbi:MAG TPA: alpha/beta fold hydrolase [Nitrolancea sp.]|nr:alpha/beta fold hydrolase [Nitrolancea sp.]